jgi:hypothetical protein
MMGTRPNEKGATIYWGMIFPENRFTLFRIMPCRALTSQAAPAFCA